MAETQIDDKFLAMMMQVEKRYLIEGCFQKYEKIRIEAWVR
jgi:hypothetical protein